MLARDEAGLRETPPRVGVLGSIVGYSQRVAQCTRRSWRNRGARERGREGLAEEMCTLRYRDAPGPWRRERVVRGHLASRDVRCSLSLVSMAILALLGGTLEGDRRAKLFAR